MRKPDATFANAELYQGDCLDILSEFAGQNIDCLITDQPYGVTKCDWDMPVNLEAFWPLAYAATKLNAAHCHFCQMPFAGRLWESNKKHFRYEYVYKKPVLTGFLNASKMPLKAHELIYIFYQKLPCYNPQKTKSKPYTKKQNHYTPVYGKFLEHSIKSDGWRCPTDLLILPPEKCFHVGKKGDGIEVHNTQKNINALLFLVKTYTNEGEVVLDPFMGAATTGIACLQTGRKFIGIEKDARYFDIACQRFELYQKKILEEG